MWLFRWNNTLAGDDFSFKMYTAGKVMFTDSGFCWQIEETELLSRKNRRLRTGKRSVVVKLYDVFVVLLCCAHLHLCCGRHCLSFIASLPSAFALRSVAVAYFNNVRTYFVHSVINALCRHNVFNRWKLLLIELLFTFVNRARRASYAQQRPRRGMRHTLHILYSFSTV